jgi:hypothetical protein
VITAARRNGASAVVCRGIFLVLLQPCDEPASTGTERGRRQQTTNARLRDGGIHAAFHFEWMVHVIIMVDERFEIGKEGTVEKLEWINKVVS